MEVAFHVRVFGRVTGVGFRYSTIHIAQKYSSMRGYVRNVDYGEVEAVFQGKKAEVEDMVAWIRRGPSLARIDDIKINEIPVNPDLGYFTVR